MKIAVAVTEGDTVSPHFGRSRAFLVFEIADGRVVGRERRDNTFTAHAAGECEDGRHEHDHAHGHGAILAALRDCQAVLCGGMGWRAAEDLKAAGVEPIALARPTTAEEVVRGLLAGTLDRASTFCRCHP